MLDLLSGLPPPTPAPAFPSFALISLSPLLSCHHERTVLALPAPHGCCQAANSPGALRYACVWLFVYSLLFTANATRGRLAGGLISLACGLLLQRLRLLHSGYSQMSQVRQRRGRIASQWTSRSRGR